MEIKKIKDFLAEKGENKIEDYLEMLISLYKSNSEALEKAKTNDNISKMVVEDLEHRDIYLKDLIKIVENIINEKILEDVHRASTTTKVDFIKKECSKEIEERQRKKNFSDKLKKDILSFEQKRQQERKFWAVIYKTKEADIFFNKYLSRDDFVKAIFNGELDVLSLPEWQEAFRNQVVIDLFLEVVADYQKVYQNVSSDNIRNEVIFNFSNDSRFPKGLKVQEIFSDLYYQYLINNKFFLRTGLSADNLNKVIKIREDLRANYDKVMQKQDTRSVKSTKENHKREMLVFRETEDAELEGIIREYNEIIATPFNYMDALDKKLKDALEKMLSNTDDIKKYTDVVDYYQGYLQKREKLESRAIEASKGIAQLEEKIAVITELKNDEKFKKDRLKASARKKRIEKPWESPMFKDDESLIPSKVQEALKCEDDRYSQLKLIFNHLKLISIYNEAISKRESFENSSISKRIINNLEIKRLKKACETTLKGCFKLLSDSNLIDIYPVDNAFYDRKDLKFRDIKNPDEFFKGGFIPFRYFANNFTINLVKFNIIEEREEYALKELLVCLFGDMSDIFTQLSTEVVVNEELIAKFENVLNKQCEFVNYLRKLNEELTYATDTNLDLSKYYSEEFVEKCRGIIELDQVSTSELTKLLYDSRNELSALNTNLSVINYNLEDLNAEMLGCSEEDYKSYIELLEGIDNETVSVATIEDSIKKLNV